MEGVLTDRRYPLKQRAPIAVLGASERFRRNYRSNSWAWKDCGPALNSFRQEAKQRFSPLILDGLAYWKRPIIQSDSMRRQFLDTLVVNGGFPVAFLEGQSPLRALLKRLIKDYVRVGEQAASQRAALEIPESRLPRSYRVSLEFAALCVELAGAIAEIAKRFDAKTTALDAHLSTSALWQEKLPMRMDSSAARQLVHELLSAASQIGPAGRVEDAVCIRELRQVAGEWSLQTRLGCLPGSLALATPTDPPSFLTLSLMANGSPVRRLAALGLQASGRYLVRPVPIARQLRIEEPFDSADTSIGLMATNGDTQIALPVRDGEALDHSLPWVFVPVASPDESDSEEHWRLAAQGDARNRESTVLLAIPLGAHADGDFLDLGPVTIGGISRQMIQTSEELTTVTVVRDTYSIRCQSPSASYVIGLHGKAVSARSPDAAIVFAGAPEVELRECDEAHELEWQASSGNQWFKNMSAAVGLVTYRALIRGEVVSRRKALVLPRGFDHQFRAVGLHGAPPAFLMRLEAGWLAASTTGAKLCDDKNEQGLWIVPVGGNGPLTGKVPSVDVFVRPPEGMAKSVATISLRGSSTVDGFRDIVRGDNAPEKISLSMASRYEAFVCANGNRLVHVSWGDRSARSVVCEVPRQAGYSLPLSWISDDLREMRDAVGSRDANLRLEIIRHGRAKILEIARKKLYCDGGHVSIDSDDDGSDKPPLERIRIRHLALDDARELDPLPGSGGWSLPQDFSAGWALITAESTSIRPVAVELGDRLEHGANARLLSDIIQTNDFGTQRHAAITQRLRAVVNQPLVPEHQEELDYLDGWLRRFDDVPNEYLDVVVALLEDPGLVLRLLIYLGNGDGSALKQRVEASPLWWHLLPSCAWTELLPWWEFAMSGDDVDATCSEEFFDSSVYPVITQCAESLHVSSSESSLFAACIQNYLVRSRLNPAQRLALSAPAKQGYLQTLREWHQAIAGYVQKGGQLPSLPLVDGLVGQASKTMGLTILPAQYATWQHAVLAAPAVCAYLACANLPSNSELRRELVWARQVDRTLFDTMYLNAYQAKALT